MYNHWIKRKTHTWTRQNPVTKSQCPIGSNVWYTFILRLITACTYILVKSLSFSIKIYFQDPHGESKASLIRKKKIPPHTPAGCKRSDSGTSQTLRLNFFGLGETNIKALLTLGIQSYLLMFENERMSPEKGPFQKERIVFQPAFFSGYVSFQCGPSKFWWSKYLSAGVWMCRVRDC